MNEAAFPITFDRHPMDHERLCTVLDALDRRYSCLTYGCLGSSILGRSIPLCILGSGKKQILYVAAHHGMEWITSTLLCRFLYEFCDAVEKNRSPYRIDPVRLCQSYTIHVIPMLNPDGVDYQIHGPDCEHVLYPRLLSMNDGSRDFSHWQANARGVDLNHNYNAGFLAYKVYEAEHNIPCGAPTKYSGSAPESEPETAALCNYIRYLGNVDLVLSLHTQGEEIYYSSGGQIPKHTPAILPHITDLTGYTAAVPTDSAAYGGLLDWCIQSLGIPSFTLECGKGSNPLPLSDASRIYSRLRALFFSLPIMI